MREFWRLDCRTLCGKLAYIRVGNIFILFSLRFHRIERKSPVQITEHIQVAQPGSQTAIFLPLQIPRPYLSAIGTSSSPVLEGSTCELMAPDNQDISASGLKREAMRLMSLEEEWGVSKKRLPTAESSRNKKGFKLRKHPSSLGKPEVLEVPKMASRSLDAGNTLHRGRDLRDGKRNMQECNVKRNDGTEAGRTGDEDTVCWEGLSVHIQRQDESEQKWAETDDAEVRGRQSQLQGEKMEDVDDEQIVERQAGLLHSKRYVPQLKVADLDENSKTKPISEFIDLTITLDPPFIASGPAVVCDDNVRALKDSMPMERFKEVFSRTTDPWRKALDADEEQIVKILTVKANPRTELAYYRTIREWVYVNVLNGSHFRVLRPHGWLSDEIINAYATLLNKRNDEINGSVKGKNRKSIPKTHVFNTFYFEKMKGKKKGDLKYEGVKRWTKRHCVGIFSFDLLLFPINIRNKHWVLAGIDIARNVFLYLDSLHGKDTLGAIQTLRKWLLEETKDKKSIAKAKSLRLRSWKCLTNKYQVRIREALPSSIKGFKASNGDVVELPLQTDDNNCGVFVTKMADCLSVAKPLFFVQSDMINLRHRVALDLYRSFIPL